MKVTLLGLEFYINNLGCEALSYSFVSELYSIVSKRNETLDITTVVFESGKTPFIPGTSIPIKCIGIKYKKLSFWKEIKELFNSSDVIFDFTMGDSFSDIYGIKRFILDALVKNIAVRSKTPYILGPQTYGPYKRAYIKSWAKKILKGATSVYARDEKSQNYAKKISNRDVFLTTDVAFALPYKKKMDPSSKKRIGFNPSGLLWMGGYTENNQFGLKLDYKEYCNKVCEYIAQNTQYELFLIPHVGTKRSESICYENDMDVCYELHKKIPNSVIIEDFETPMEVKGYIASMDVFVGARMHATIGAFSSGVATIPVSYSRKFEGLYESLDYSYLISACEISTEEAVELTKKYIENSEKLTESVRKSLMVVNQKQREFRKELEKEIKNATE